MNSPRVSIVTPCYNHGPFLADYFQGLLTQTYRNLEIVLIDDGSTDDSWDVIRAHESRLRQAFPSVVCHRQENVGMHQTFARAVGLAGGAYLCILESDDFYLPTKIEENVRYLDAHPEAGLVHSDVDVFIAGRRDVAVHAASGRHIPTGDVFEKLLLRNFVVTCATCVRTDLFRAHVPYQSFVERGYLMADYPIWLHLARHTPFGYIDRSLACYRIREESASHSHCPYKNHRFWKSTCQVKRDLVQAYGASPAVAHEIEHAYHLALFYKGYELFLKDDCLEGYRWLLREKGAPYRRFSQRLRTLAVRHRLLWQGTRMLEKWKNRLW